MTHEGGTDAGADSAGIDDECLESIVDEVTPPDDRTVIECGDIDPLDVARGDTERRRLVSAGRPDVRLQLQERDRRDAGVRAQLLEHLG